MRSQTTDIPGCSDRRPPRPPPVRRSWAPIAVLLWAAFAGPPATATGQRPQPPRFYVESVAVEGVRRASPEVIVSESLLEEGIAYTESELRQAVYRVGRLPFVLDATFSLAKGSERGKYSLLITVEEVRSLFFGTDLVYSAQGNALADASPLGDELTDTLSAGIRLFAGRGVLFAALAAGEGLQVGYERYRLFGRPVLLRFAYARQACCVLGLQELGFDPTAAVWAADESDRLELTIGVPLGGNHSLRFDGSRLETGSAARRPLGGGEVVDARDVEQRELELAWVFDSTDDPVFPSRGDALTAAIGVRWLEGDLSRPLASEPSGAVFTPEASPLGLSHLRASGATRMSSRLVGLSVYGARHWPLSARQTVSLSLKLLLGRSAVENIPVPADLPPAPAASDRPADSGDRAVLLLESGDVDTLEAGFGARYSLNLWQPSKLRRRGELRWETVAGLIYVETSPVFSSAAHPLWGVSLSTGIALRNTWGIFRIGFTFLDYDGEL